LRPFGLASTSSWLTSEMCEHSRVYRLGSWYLTKPPRPTQPGHPSAGRQNELAMVTDTTRGEFCVTVGYC